MTEIVTLTSGAQVPRPALVATLMNAEELAVTNPIAFYELVQAARNPDHQMFGNTGEVVAKWGMGDSAGGVNSTVCEVIAAAVVGDNFDLRFVNPIAPVTGA